MRFASAVSTHRDPARAVEEAAGRIREGLGGAKPDLAFLFPTPHHGQDPEALLALARTALGTDTLLGASGAGVLAGGREVENAPALALMAGVLGGSVRARLFHVANEALESGVDWPRLLGVQASEAPGFVLLPDPFSINGDALLAGLDEAYPGSPKVGGMASGGEGPGSHVLFCGEDVHRQGAVGLVLTGGVLLEPLVSQGCRPVGPRLVITKGERNIVRELAGRPALAVIREALQKLEGRDRELAASGLLIGRVVDEAKDTFHRGDFLIRGLMGADEGSGAVAVGDLIRRGQTVQLQVRDAASADEDLKALLAHRGEALRKAPPSAALVFSCNGRGVGMYGDADHDSRVLREAVPGLPLAGFFCNGEIGPIGSRTFVHGFTSSVGFLRPARPPSP